MDATVARIAGCRLLCLLLFALVSFGSFSLLGLDLLHQFHACRNSRSFEETTVAILAIGIHHDSIRKKNIELYGYIYISAIYIYSGGRNYHAVGWRHTGWISRQACPHRPHLPHCGSGGCTSKNRSENAKISEPPFIDYAAPLAGTM